MDMETKTNEYYTIDLAHIFKMLLNKVWLIIAAGFLAGAIGFSISAFLIAPTYSSSVMLYVNNKSSSTSNPNFNISSSDITAAQNLVKTYREILNNRTTLNLVLEKTGLEDKYTYRQLSGMIAAASSNGTEIMKVTVTAEDSEEAAIIANCIAEVLPGRIDAIIDGASMKVVEWAISDNTKVGPSITKYTAMGIVLGVLGSVMVVAIAALMDGTIHDEDYVLQHYNCPVLAKVPDLMDTGSKRNKRYGYYYREKSRSEK